MSIRRIIVTFALYPILLLASARGQNISLPGASIAAIPCNVENHAKTISITDPDSHEDCTNGGGSGFPPHECACYWDGASGVWRLHSHGVISNDLSVVGDGSPANITVETTEADIASLVISRDTSGTEQEWRIRNTPNLGFRDVTTGENPFVIEPGALTNSIRVDSGGLVGIGTSTPNETLTVEGGVISILETTVPTATTNYAKLWAEDNNELFFQDGDGTTHLLHGDAFGNLWHHGISSATVTISTQGQATLIDSFSVVGGADDLGNVTGSASTNLLTIGAGGAGKHDIGWHSSFTVGGGAKRVMIILPGIVLASPNAVTNATETTPIVLTVGSHPYENGDMLEVVGVGGNTAANGTSILQNVSSTTVDLYDTQGAAVASSGTYTSGGEVTIFYPAELLGHRTVSQTDPGVAGGGGPGIDVALAASDSIGIYVINNDSTNNLLVLQITLGTERIGD